jgi:hypothetical protein
MYGMRESRHRGKERRPSRCWRAESASLIEALFTLLRAIVSRPVFANQGTG